MNINATETSASAMAAPSTGDAPKRNGTIGMSAPLADLAQRAGHQFEGFFPIQEAPGDIPDIKRIQELIEPSQRHGIAAFVKKGDMRQPDQLDRLLERVWFVCGEFPAGACNLG